MHDVLRALGGRLREPNSVVRASRAPWRAAILIPTHWLQVVFKALIVLHQMIRAGSTDNVLSYLANNTGSSGDVLRLRNVTAQAWDGQSTVLLAQTAADQTLIEFTGYTPPANLGFYAQYLDARIRGYKELKHDPVRVQAESNRMSNYEGSSGTSVRYPARRALRNDFDIARRQSQEVATAYGREGVAARSQADSAHGGRIGAMQGEWREEMPGLSLINVPISCTRITSRTSAPFPRCG